jgi:hypothetical protein
MSWHFSRVLGEAYLEANSLDGEQFAPSNGTDTHGTFWLPGKTTDALKPSRSGMTFRPLTESHGEELLTWYLEAFHAKTSLPLAKEPESKESEAVCGNTWRESSAKFDRNTHSWKTHRCLWDEDLPSSSLTLPKWGMMRSGVLWERITSPLHTDETESGSLPTPRATDGTKGSRTAEGAEKEWARGRNKDLGMVAAMWPTPRACMTGAATPERLNDKNRNLEKAVAQTIWPTPGANEDSYRLKGNSQQSCGLGAIARREALEGDPASGGQLNPTWVEWLIGWPLFWTSLDINVKPYYDLWHESQQWTQASSEKIQGNIVRNVWWDIDPATTSHGREPDQQSSDECDDCLPTVPREDPLLDRELGAGEHKADGLQDLRRDVQAQTCQKVNALWQAGMPEGKRETIGRVAMGVKNRVDRLRCIGNGQVPAVAALAWNLLTKPNRTK